MQHDDGRTTITCLCESPMFVQAPLHAKRLNDDTATVYRLSGVAEGDDVESKWSVVLGCLSVLCHTFFCEFQLLIHSFFQVRVADVLDLFFHVGKKPNT